MPAVPIIMPQLGESIAEAAIISFLVKPGQLVEADQDIIEVETNKATLNLAAPCRGKIDKFVVNPTESYPVGAVLGYLEASSEDAARVGLDAPAADTNGKGTETSGATGAAQGDGGNKKVRPTVRGLPVPANAAGASYMSPRMKARLADLGFHAADLAGIAGSGAAGRVTIEDLEKFIEHVEKNKLSQASPMRVAVADAMRRSWTRPLATVALPVRFDAMLAHRKISEPKPGPALYGLRALAVALAENSAPAGRLI